MKNRWLILILTLLLFSCGEEKPQLTFKPVSYTGEICAECPKISVNIPHALDKTKIATTINTALREEIIYLLTFDDSVEATTIDEAITSFKNGFLELKNKFPDETMGWEAKIDGKICYDEADILTIKLDSYIYTGGAHGYGASTFLNFDKQKGTELENNELFKNIVNFQKFAEIKFREKEGIPKDKSINSTGYMFEDEIFKLPETMGFTENGLQLIYNRYEVASYSDGAIELTLPYDEVNTFLAVDYREK